MSIELTGVTHGYDGTTVLRDVDMHLEPGVVVAVVGPSGSGKTTLLSILGLLLAPDAGMIRIGGDDLTRDSANRGRMRAAGISWVFQTANVVPYRTAIDNVALGLLKTGADRTTALAGAALALASVGLAAKAQAHARTLSGGELQRICIARALTSAPTLLLADEPTGQLDGPTSRSIGKLLSVPRPTTVTVLATHDMELAANCQRILTLADGRLTEASL